MERYDNNSGGTQWQWTKKQQRESTMMRGNTMTADRKGQQRGEKTKADKIVQ